MARWEVVKEAASHLYMKTTLSDVKFTFSNEANAEPVPAHKFILAMRSSEFEDMFYNSKSSTGTMDITETKREMFLHFLKFLYTEDVSLSNSNVTSILHLSYKYHVTKLTNISQKYLLEILSPVTVCSILNISRNYKMISLQSHCISYIDENTTEVLQDSDWLSLSLENLKLVLSRDKLSSPEKDIFEAVMRWASEKCKRQGVDDTGKNKRAVLRDALYQIRVPTMSLEDYNRVVIRSGVLTDSEELAIFKHFVSASVQPLEKFVTKPRNGCQIIIELKSTTNFESNQAIEFAGFSQQGQKLNIVFSLKSRKTIKSMVIDLSNIKQGCKSPGPFAGSICRGITDEVDALVLQIEYKGENREIKVTKSSEPTAVNIFPPISLTTAQRDLDKLSHLKGDSNHEVRIFLYRKNCPNCRADRCPQIANGTYGHAQDKDIQISFEGLDIVKSITFI